MNGSRTHKSIRRIPVFSDIFCPACRTWGGGSAAGTLPPPPPPVPVDGNEWNSNVSRDVAAPKRWENAIVPATRFQRGRHLPQIFLPSRPWNTGISWKQGISVTQSAVLSYWRVILEHVFVRWNPPRSNRKPTFLSFYAAPEGPLNIRFMSFKMIPSSEKVLKWPLIAFSHSKSLRWDFPPFSMSIRRKSTNRRICQPKPSRTELRWNFHHFHRLVIPHYSAENY